MKRAKVKHLTVLATTALALLAFASPAWAANFNVNQTGDASDRNQGNGQCDTSTQTGLQCTLRAAVQEANALGGNDAISFSAVNTYTVGSELTVTSNLTITGRGANTIVQANASPNTASHRVLGVSSGTVTVSNLTIQNGRTDNGGGVYNSGTLTLDGVTVTDNFASGGASSGFGGGIYNNGVLTVRNDSKVQNNEVTTFYGGGIFNRSGGRVTVDGSSITDNVVPDNKNGGGIYTQDEGSAVTIRNGSIVGSNTAGYGAGVFVSGGTASVADSTITANSGKTDLDSGGIYNDAALTLSRSTISGNSGGVHSWGTLTATNTTISGNTNKGLFARSRSTAPLGSATLTNVTIANNGKGLSRTAGLLEIKNTLLANTGDNCADGVTSRGTNLSDDDTCSLSETGDLSNRTINDANFGPLENNGGPTETHALLAGNPALDAGEDAVTGPPLNLTTDQRGAGFPRKRHEHVDIGALEQAVAPETTITAGPNGPTNDSTPEFRFSSNDAAATFECRTDAAAFAACSSPFTAPALADGDHSFEVRAKSPSGTDASPAGRSFPVDTAPPGTYLDSPANDSFTNDPTPAFSGEAGNASGDAPDVTVKIYAGTAAAGPPVATLPTSREPNNSFSVSPTDRLPDGAYAAVAEQGDHAGNTGLSAPRLFTVDTAPPIVEITEGPTGETGDSTPTFEFSAEAGATLACMLDGTNVSPCASTFTAQRLADGPHVFEVGATDRAGNAATATRSFSVLSPPPTADDDAYATDEDKTLTVGSGDGLLAGDTDAEDDPLSVMDEDAGAPGVQPASGPGHGTLTLEEGGSFAYEPENDFNGEDSFTYTATDGNKKSAPATVTLTVRPVNDAPSFALPASPDQTIDEDPELGAQAVAGFAAAVSPGPANEGDQSVVFEVSDDNPALFTPGGRPTVAADGTLSYTPAEDANGETTVTVTARDTGGTERGGLDRSARKTFTITVNAVNDAPVPGNDRRFTPEDVPLVLAASQLTANDDAGASDEDGQKLTVTEVSGAVNGTVALVGTEITFTPTPGFNGQAAFEYTVCDDGVLPACSTHKATVFVAVSPVNTAPTAADGSYALDEDTGPIEIDFGALVSDAETDPADLSYTVSDPGPAGGTLSGDGPVREFTPAPDSNGVVEIPYTATDRGDPDGCGAPDETCDAPKTSEAAKVSVTVRPVDDDPSFEMGPDQTVDEDAGRQEVTNWATNISAGPGEADQVVSFQLTGDNADLFSTQPRLAPDGTLVYTPARDANGRATVTVAISDGAASRAAGPLPRFGITVRPVNDAPRAADDAATTTDRAWGVNVGVLANDTDADTGDRLRVARFERPNHGTVTEEQDGTLTYVPDRGFSGEDDFLYTVSDGNGGTDTARVRVTVRDETAPEVVGTTRFLRSVNDERTIRVGVVFSESMDAGTLDGRTFTLTEKGANRPVAAQVRYDEKNKSALLTPNRPLKNGTGYTARVEGGADGPKDLSGNPLEKGRTWSFEVRQ